MQHEVLTAGGARAEFDQTVTYLNTATYGLPPRRSWAELDLALAAYRAGRVNPPSYDRSVQRARSAFARLVDVDVAQVAVGAQVSSFVGLIAASLPPGSEVLTATGDFTSLLFPFHVQQARGLTVREAPLEEIAESVTRRTTLVAVSLVQSADGRLVDLPRLREFMGSLPLGRRFTIEFRHESWFEDDVFEALRERDIALCVTEQDEFASPVVATATWGYARLHKVDYDEAGLVSWAGKLKALPWKEAYVFFKHDEGVGSGPPAVSRFSHACVAD